MQRNFFLLWTKNLGCLVQTQNENRVQIKNLPKESFNKSAVDAKKAVTKATKELTIDDAKKLGLGKGYNEDGEYIDVAGEMYNNLPQDTAQIKDNSTQAYNKGKDFNLVDVVLGWGDN